MCARLPWLMGLALPFLAGPVTGQEAPPPFGVPGFEIERVSRIASVAEGLGVTVVNRFGDVRARFGGYEGRAEVFANVQQFDDEGPRLLVETRKTPAGVEVSVGYRVSESGELVTAPDPGWKKRADMVVWVPRGAPLAVTTVDGLVDLRGLESDVRAVTAGGAIKARKMRGALDFRSGSGEVLVVLESWDGAREHSFASEAGDLSVVLGGEADTTIRVATSGLVSTDVSLGLDYRADRRPVRRAEALLGEGSGTVTISSGDGHVRLIRRPLAREALLEPEPKR